jgi:hypothetical protein
VYLAIKEFGACVLVVLVTETTSKFRLGLGLGVLEK